jgi:hypothetical protein
MKTKCSSKILVGAQWSIQHSSPEDKTLHNGLSKNLKLHEVPALFGWSRTLEKLELNRKCEWQLFQISTVYKKYISKERNIRNIMLQIENKATG